jgi:hypothetical protein
MHMVVQLPEQDFIELEFQTIWKKHPDFEIFGELEHGWERFIKNTNYRAFIIKLKDEDN